MEIYCIITTAVFFFALVFWRLNSGKELSKAMLKQNQAPAGPLPDELKEKIRALVRSGRKIEAIKQLRQQTSMGLKASKDAVEAIEREP